MRLFCFGYGYVAQHFVASLPKGAVWHGTSRSPSSDAHLFVMGADGVLDEAGQKALNQATHLLISIPPNEEGADAALMALERYPINSTQWIGYLSTTGVYGDTGGEWVDEISPTNPIEPRSIRRLEAEKQWLNEGAEIFRLAGIYGPDRNALENLKNGRAKQRIDAPEHVFGRIHVSDISKALQASAERLLSGDIYNLADDLPSTSREVIEYAAELLGTEPPPLVNLAEAELSEMARSFYGACRRVKNSKIKQLLGVKLEYPTYREGLLALNLHNRERMK